MQNRSRNWNNVRKNESCMVQFYNTNGNLFQLLSQSTNLIVSYAYTYMFVIYIIHIHTHIFPCPFLFKTLQKRWWGALRRGNAGERLTRAMRNRTNKDRGAVRDFRTQGASTAIRAPRVLLSLPPAANPAFALYMYVYIRVCIPTIRKYVHSRTYKCVLERERELLARREYSWDVDNGVDGIVFLWLWVVSW